MAKNQEKTTTKHLATRKFHANEIHTKICHPGGDRMRVISKHIHCRVNGALEVCEECDMSKIKKELLRKVAEERYLNPGEIININIISHKKSSYGGSKNWILIQDSYTKKRYFFMNSKGYITEKSTLS